jgi:MFS family permease
VVFALYGLGSLLSGPLGGQLADRVGRRRTLLIGFTWGALAMLLVPFARGPLWVALSAWHLGLAGDLYRPAIQAAVADLCPPEQRPRAYGLLYWAVNLGWAAAIAMGGMLSRHGFARLFVIDAATTLAFAGIVALFVPETRPSTTERASMFSSLRVLVVDRVLMRFVLTQCLVGLVFVQPQVALQVALARKGIEPNQYGLVMSLNGVLIVALQAPALKLIARLRRTHALALGALLCGIGFGWNVWPFGVIGAATSVALWTLGELMFSPVAPAIIADLAPDGMRGRYQGVNQMTWGGCALLGPLLGMPLLEHGGPDALWLSCLATCVIAAAFHLASAPQLGARLAGKGNPA